MTWLQWYKFFRTPLGIRDFDGNSLIRAAIKATLMCSGHPVRYDPKAWW